MNSGSYNECVEGEEDELAMNSDAELYQCVHIYNFIFI